MTDEKIPLRKWLEMQRAGEFDAFDFATQVKAGWYDWFCKDNRLAVKTRILAPKVAKIAKSPKVDIDKQYVWFKNNCPMVGTLYDDFRIADIESGNTVWCVVPRSGHTSQNGRAELWGKENSFAGPIVEGTWKDVLKYMGVK